MWVPRYSPRVIRATWVAIILWFEVGVFLAARARCRWPDAKNGDATRVLLIADPQILDERSYPGRKPLLRAASRIFVDMNLLKAWRVAKSTRPHAVIFLGDMMDNGFADMDITSYQKYVGRFHTMFSTPRSLPVYYVPGNHDVGLGDTHGTSALARPRYKSAFGPLSQHVVLGGHSLFMVDAPALVDEDWRKEGVGENRTDGLLQDLEYLRHIRTERAADAPLILFTHIPLYRPPNSNCGPLREKGYIPTARGVGYQTLLTPETSQLLLDSLRPTLIFSGDDHDYCEYVHTYQERSILEVTVKSLSIAMGIREPGFQLLSLSNESRTSAHQPCSLPDQLRIYCWVYAPLALATIVLVAARAALAPPSPPRRQKHAAKSSLELPTYRASLQRPSHAPPRKRSYPLRVVGGFLTIAWLPLTIYVVVSVAVFW